MIAPAGGFALPAGGLRADRCRAGISSAGCTLVASRLIAVRCANGHDLHFQFLDVDGLANRSGSVQTKAKNLRLGQCRDEDDWNVREFRRPQLRLAEGEPITDRHHHVQEDKARSVFSGELQRLGSVGRFQDVKTEGAHDQREDV